MLALAEPLAIGISGNTFNICAYYLTEQGFSNTLVNNGC